MALNSGAKKILKTVGANVTEYTQDSTIHGIKYVVDRKKPLAHQIFWTVIITTSISCLGYFAYNIFNKWFDNSVMIVNETTETRIFHIPFPAVTICPVIKSDLAKSNHTEYAKKYLLSMQICRESLVKRNLSQIKETYKLVKEPDDSDFTKKILDFKWMDTLIEISSPHKDVFSTCQFAVYPNPITTVQFSFPLYQNCKRLFHPILTNDGLCYTFNTIDDVLRNESLHTEFAYHQINKVRDGWDPENGYSKADTYPHKAIVKGDSSAPNGLKMVLTTIKGNKTALCYPRSLGYTLILHSPSEYPHTYNKYISLEYDTKYSIVVEPKIIRTCKELRSVPPETRNCYFNDERQLKFFRFYNQQNCRLECYANNTAVNEGCVAISSPRDGNTSNCDFSFKTIGFDQPNYNRIVNDHSTMWGIKTENVDELEGFDCNCLPECNSIHYDYVIDQMGDDTSIGGNEESVRGISKSSTKYKTTVEIMFEKPSFTGEHRVFVYTFDSLVSDFGGLLGLFMGGSLLSIIELFYFLTLQNCFKSACCRRHNQSK